MWQIPQKLCPALGAGIAVGHVNSDSPLSELRILLGYEPVYYLACLTLRCILGCSEP